MIRPTRRGRPGVLRLFILRHAPPLLSAEDERDLGRKVRAGDRVARDRFATANIRLVVRIATGYRDRGMDLVDRIGAGMVGLMKAVDHYDPERGTRFSTYASFWIRQAIDRAVAEQVRTIRIPMYGQLWVSSYHTGQSLSRREPSPGIAAQLLEAMEVQTVSTDTAEDRVEWIRDPDPGPLESMLQVERRVERRKVLHQALGLLDERSALVIRLHFGLDGGVVWTLEQIAQRLGVTKQRVQQIEGKAMDRLRLVCRAWRNDGWPLRNL